MNSLEALQNFVVIQIPWQVLVVDILLTAFFALVLKLFYIKHGQSLSNRKQLANNFVAIAVTTALVITIVKSSLALSLGLVGALSIVRFRTAIKDPEELSYLFLSIALGLGFGASQRVITTIAFLVILAVLFVQKLISQKSHSKDNLYMSLETQSDKFDLEKALELISQHTDKVDLRKVSSEEHHTKLAGLVEFSKADDLNKLMMVLKKSYPKAKISFIDTDKLI